MTAKTPNKPMPLGRGLSALFGDADTAYQARPSVGASASGGPSENSVRMIPIEWIQPGAFQPRRHFDQESLRELASSMKEHGILQPLMVRAIAGEKDFYEIIAGERRWRAAQYAGIHAVPVLVKTFSDRDAMEIGLIENVQRKDLSPIEEAEGYKRLMTEFDYSDADLVKTVGKSRIYINNLIRLLTLPDPVKKMLTDGTLSMGHARTIITASDPTELAAEIVKKGLSVRQAEALARRAAARPKSNKPRVVKGVDADIQALEKKLEQALGLKVNLLVNGHGGGLTIYFRSLGQLDGLVKKLSV